MTDVVVDLPATATPPVAVSVPARPAERRVPSERPTTEELVRPLPGSRPGAIDIDLDTGVRISVDTNVNEKALVRVLRALQDAMLALSSVAREYLAFKPVSMRKGFDGLAALTRELFDADPFCGPLFPLRGRSADYFMAIHWDGAGMFLFAKRLEKGKFVWPPLVDGGVVLSPAQLAMLIERIDWRRTVTPPPTRVPTLV